MYSLLKEQGVAFNIDEDVSFQFFDIRPASTMFSCLESAEIEQTYSSEDHTTNRESDINDNTTNS